LNFNYEGGILKGELFEYKKKTSKAKQDQSTKRANTLDGKTWTKYSISIWNDIRKSPEELKIKHPAMFPVQLASRVIECFTNEEDKVVFDPFMGIGSTLIAANRLGKIGIGIEIYKKYVDIAKSRLSQTQLLAEQQPFYIHCTDARNLLNFVKEESIDLVLTSPPYWNILTQKRTADSKEIRQYGDEKNDLGRITNYQDFLKALKDIFQKVYQTLKKGKYCIVVVMDIRKGPKFYPFHSDIANLMQEIGFIYDDFIIWDRRHEYNNIRPLGYPSVFRINRVHEFILIFKKPKSLGEH
jgi:DNA modification methylase